MTAAKSAAPNLLVDLGALRVDPDLLSWEPFRPGIRVHWLYRTGPDGPASAFLRYEPGASVPMHRHPGTEHLFVLSGSQSDEHGRYAAGSLVVNPPGSRHSVRSEEGCLVLLVWEKPVVLEG
jgi:anti-sigma factor ChrR (cupin superfamily)